MTKVNDAPWLVERRVKIDAVTECLGYYCRKLRKPVRSVAILPPTLALQVTRKVPMVQSDHRANAVTTKLANEPLVEFQSTLIDLA